MKLPVAGPEALEFRLTTWADGFEIHPCKIGIHTALIRFLPNNRLLYGLNSNIKKIVSDNRCSITELQFCCNLSLIFISKDKYRNGLRCGSKS